MKYILFNTELEKALTAVAEGGAASVDKWIAHYHPDRKPLEFDSVEQAEKLARALGPLGFNLVTRPTHAMMLTIVRGLPGSGKSTYCKEYMSGIFHVEADMFHMANAKYAFDINKLKQRHALAQQMTELALMEGADVVVSNTFTTMKEVEPYLALGRRYNADVQVIHIVGNYGNIHNVPADVLEKMRTRWEGVEGEIEFHLPVFKTTSSLPD